VDLDGKTHVTRCRKDVSQRAKDLAYGFRMVDRERWTYLMARCVTSFRHRVTCVHPSPQCLRSSSHLQFPCVFPPRLRVLVRRAKLRHGSFKERVNNLAILEFFTITNNTKNFDYSRITDSLYGHQESWKHT
jgi:hypothetical protein